MCRRVSQLATKRLSRAAISTLVLLLFSVALMAPARSWGEKKKDVLDQELDKFWADQRQVRIIQKKRFPMDGRFEGNVYFGVIPNDDFILYMMPGVRFQYHFAESFGVELDFYYAFNASNSDLLDFLRETQAEVDIPQKQKLSASIDGIWSPFYGKLSFLGSKLVHFDLYFAVGVGFLWTEVTPKKDPNPENQYDVSANVGAGFKFMILEWLGIRVDYRQFFHKKFAGGVAFPAQITLGFSFFTAAKR